MMINILVRLKRYFECIGLTIGSAPLVVLAIAIYFVPSRWPIFVCLSIGSFAAPYPLRHSLIRQIERPLMDFLDRRLLSIGIGCAIVLKVSAGITRPVVFSFMDPMGELNAEEILEKYRQWYVTEGRKVIERDVYHKEEENE